MLVGRWGGPSLDLRLIQRSLLKFLSHFLDASKTIVQPIFNLDDNFPI
jgi:hypothetical protein